LRVYMDVCCLSRMFDDQTQEKIRFETEAIISILNRCNTRSDWELIGSDAIVFEASNAPDAVKKQKVLLLHEGASERLKSNDEIKARAAKFCKTNIKPMDSLHLAIAEYANADVILTTDSKFLKAAKRSEAKVHISNPLDFYLEVIKDG